MCIRDRSTYHKIRQQQQGKISCERQNTLKTTLVVDCLTILPLPLLRGDCMIRFVLSRSCSTTLIALALTGRTTQAFLPTAFRSSFRPLRMSSTDVAKRVLVPIADGSEEIETTCITDTLTRFGADVVVASVMPGQLVCKMSRGIKVRSSGMLTNKNCSCFRKSIHSLCFMVSVFCYHRSWRTCPLMMPPN